MAHTGADLAAEWTPLSALTPWAENPRDNDHAVDAVAKSISTLGFGAPIVARRENGEIIAGHTRFKAATKLGLEQVPVRFMDIDEKEAHQLALADNRLGELADWSEGLPDVLRSFEADELPDLGWSEDELAVLLEPPPPGGGSNDLPPVPSNPVSRVGEVYQLGPHRLICGDSTDPEVWALLMEGEKLQMAWADPPYGVGYVGGARAEAEGTQREGIGNDDLDDESLEALLRASLGAMLDNCKPGAVWYVAADPGPRGHPSSCVLRNLGVWRWSLAWVKESFTLGRGDYHPRYEQLFYGWKPGEAHYFVDDRTQDTVFECPRPRASDDHPTMKPVALVERCLRNSAKTGWLVGDPFAGSGTTLIAAASLGMRARCIELKPMFVDVIRTRWTTYADKHGLDAGSGALR